MWRTFLEGNCSALLSLWSASRGLTCKTQHMPGSIHSERLMMPKTCTSMTLTHIYIRKCIKTQHGFLSLTHALLSNTTIFVWVIWIELQTVVLLILVVALFWLKSLCLLRSFMFDEPSSYLDVKQRLKAAITIRSLIRPDRSVQLTWRTGWLY